MHFFFLWVKSADVALSRVWERVLKGGHDVPEAVVRRRFGRSIRNFFAEYRRLADSWYLFDNSGGTPAIVAFERAGKPRIEAVAEVIDEHARLALPLYIWRDGKVVELSAQEVRRDSIVRQGK